MTVPSNVTPNSLASSAWANQFLQAVRDEITANRLDFTGASLAGNILTLSRRNGSSVVLTLPEDELPDYPSGGIGELVLRSRSDGVLYWDSDREVPSTPGTSTGVGHVLTVTGENDNDYAWRAPTGGSGGGGTDATARAQISSEISNREAADTALGERITTNAGNIGELQTTQGNHASSIADNEGRITTAEGDIDDLQAEAATTLAAVGGNTTAIETETTNRVNADTALGTRIDNIVIPPAADLSAYRTSAAQDVIDTAETTARTNADNALGTRIDDLSENGVRVVAVSGWDANDAARNLHIAIYPPETIGRNVTLRFSLGGVAHTANSGDGIDANGGIVTLPVNAANSATLTRSAARDGHLAIDWTYGGNVYHGYIDYIPPGEAGGLTTAEVNTQIRALVADWAETGNTGTIPDDKIAADIARDTEVTAAINALTIPTFTRYANEAALPSTVPANTIAWYPES